MCSFEWMQIFTTPNTGADFRATMLILNWHCATIRGLSSDRIISYSQISHLDGSDLVPKIT